MARDIICDLCHVEVAIVMIGNLSNGEQTAFCPGCRILDCLGTLDQQLNEEAKAAIAAQWAPSLSPAPAAEDGAADAPKSRSRGRRSPQQGVSDSGPAQGPAEAAEAATAVQAPQSDRGLAEPPAAADDG